MFSLINLLFERKGLFRMNCMRNCVFCMKSRAQKYVFAQWNIYYAVNLATNFLPVFDDRKFKRNTKQKKMAPFPLHFSVLMLCAPSNRRRPFSYHAKMAAFEYFRVLSVFSWKKNRLKLRKSVLNMASSDSQIDKPQRERPKRADLPDVNTGAQSINMERASLNVVLREFRMIVAEVGSLRFSFLARSRW